MSRRPSASRRAGAVSTASWIIDSQPEDAPLWPFGTAVTVSRADGPETQPAAFPADRGGPLFARAGALIPLGPDQAHWGQKPVETLTVEVFPGNRAEPFALFEDDGDTEAYRNGEWARTEFDQRVDGDTLVLSVSPRAGSYDGMPERRRYRFEIHGPRPGAVRVGGRPYSDWRYEADRSRVIVPLEAAPAEQSIELTGFGR